MDRLRARSRTLRAITLLALIGALAAGCGSAGSASLSPVGAANEDRTGGQPAASGAPGTGGGAVAGGDGQAILPDGSRIVYTGSMSLRVTDVDAAVADARDLVDRAGGYVGGSRLSTDGKDAVASLVYRIPADRWEETVVALRDLGTLIDETTDSADVTGQLVDLEARIRNLRASETALQRIAEQATQVEDILTVERRLTELRGQIEQLDAQRAALEDRASYGTLTVTFGREVVAVVEAARGWDPAAEVDRATGTLVNVLQAVTSAGIVFAIVWLPILLVLGGVALLVRLVLRRSGIVRANGSAGTS